MGDCGFFENLRGRHLVLASGSPRRRQLLSQLGVDFDVRGAGDVDESFPAGMPAMDVAPMLARHKGIHYKDTVMLPDEVVVTADTVVIIDSEVLGKPVDEAEAKDMLRRLSGRTHEVVTGINVEWDGGSVCRSAVTRVTFAPLSDSEIDYYVNRFRPLDKAGAYGIQEWIGAVGVKHIEGSFYNVMGLPLHLLANMLKMVS